MQVTQNIKIKKAQDSDLCFFLRSFYIHVLRWGIQHGVCSRGFVWKKNINNVRENRQHDKTLRFFCISNLYCSNHIHIIGYDYLLFLTFLQFGKLGLIKIDLKYDFCCGLNWQSTQEQAQNNDMQLHYIALKRLGGDKTRILNTHVNVKSQRGKSK